MPPTQTWHLGCVFSIYTPYKFSNTPGQCEVYLL